MKRSWAERWQNQGLFVRLLRPVSWVYAGLWRILWIWRTRRPPVRVHGIRVISVGNLSVGGTGKSALVRALALASIRRGKRTAVLMRGYGAAPGRRPLWVSRGRGAIVDVNASGDEAQEHARIKGLGVLIDADRLQGARAASLAKYQVLILDDGFQRRWQLHRDADLLLATGQDIALGERLLPAGPWREPWSQARFATTLLLQDASPGVRLTAPWSNLPLIKVGYQAQRLWKWVAGDLTKGPSLVHLRNATVMALSGLGQPTRFEKTLSSLGATVQSARFADHYRYTQADLEALDTSGVKAICTTMKDVMRLPKAWKAPVPVWVLEAKLVSQPPIAFTRLVKQLLQ